VATIPNEVTFVAGAVLTAAQLNTNLRDAINFLITNAPMCVVRQTANQSLVASTYAPITFDAEDRDNDGMHSTVSNTSRMTAQTAGWYECGGTVSTTNTAAATSRGAKWTVNGADVGGSQTFLLLASGTVAIVAPPTKMLFLNVGDYVELQGITSGASPTTASAANTSQQCGANVHWISTA
jgi:hypothetical protein